MAMPATSSLAATERDPLPRVGRAARLASALVLAYVRHAPVNRGKGWLARRAKSFLVVELEPGVLVRATDPSSPVEDRMIRHGILEPETARAFAALVTPGATVLDIGANIGQYTLMAAVRVGPAGRVHAFEPTPPVAASLARNVALNRFTWVAVNALAVSDTSGMTRLSLHPKAPDINSIVGQRAPGPSIEVPTITLDEYVATRDIPRVDLIKLDVEGAEPRVLRGGRALLTRPDGPLLFVEVNPEALEAGGTSAEEVYGLLRECGYTWYPIEAHDQYGYCNIIALKPAHHERYGALRDLAATVPNKALGRRT